MRTKDSVSHIQLAMQSHTLAMWGGIHSLRDINDYINWSVLVHEDTNFELSYLSNIIQLLIATEDPQRAANKLNLLGWRLRT